MIFEWPPLEQTLFQGTKNTRRAFEQSVISFAKRRIQNDQTRPGAFGKATVGRQSQIPQSGIIILIMIAVFLIGMGAGGILSKTKQTSTHDAAMIFYPGQK